MSLHRRTKIIATLGPACDEEQALEQLISAGVNVVRLNLSHGKHQEHRDRATRVRNIAQAQNRDIGVLADLQGPKIRIAAFKNGPVQLQAGATFTLDVALPENHGDQDRVGLTYPELVEDVVPGDELLLDDGKLELRVVNVERQAIVCTVLVGGELSNNKGINRRGGGLSADALTDKDREDLKFACEIKADYVAISFPRSADDIFEVRRLLEAQGSKAGVVAKIERAEGLENIESIAKASDAVMVARGDLGLEIGFAALPGAQKHIIKVARETDCVSITATQMMDSMVTHSIPTRAEVSDVANAVMDGTDAVMLSQETAIGQHPAKVVQTMHEVCVGAEKHRSDIGDKKLANAQFARTDQAIAQSTMFLSRHYPLKAIVAMSESGATALSMSRIRSGIPIFCLTSHGSTRRRVALYRGVYPLDFDFVKEFADFEQPMIDLLKAHEVVVDGELIAFTHGDLKGIAGGTNTLKVVTVQ